MEKTRTEIIDIVQKASIGNTTQIAVQNNFAGLSPQEASELAVKLFLDNFPQLQRTAGEVAKKRAEELCEEAILRITEKGITDFDAFEDPGVQYSLYEAQKVYARYGGENNLRRLAGLLSDRILSNKRPYLSRVFDKAIEVSGMLMQKHLDYLSIIFLVKMVKFSEIREVSQIEEKYKEFAEVFPIGESYYSMASFLNMLGCFELGLGSAADHLSKTYNLPKSEINRVLPSQYDYVPGDYVLSPVGIVLAIINIRNKTDYVFEYNMWIVE